MDIDTLVQLSWRVYPAAGLMALGTVLSLRGVRLAGAGLRRPLSGSMQSLTWMRGFRLTIIGLAVAGVGAAWLWQIGWLLALALAIGGEETLESSIAIAALRRARDRPRDASAAPHRPTRVLTRVLKKPSMWRVMHPN